MIKVELKTEDVRRILDRYAQEGFKRLVTDCKKIGVVEPSHSAHYNARTESTVDTMELTKANVFGTDKIPPRPIFSDFENIQREELRQVIKKNCQIVKERPHTGEPPYLRLRFNAIAAAAEAKEMLKDWVWKGYYKTTVPNAPRTILEKGSDTPWIDTFAWASNLFVGERE